jgi:biopolymer transport protein ExbB
MPDPVPTLGVAHFLAQADAVGRAVLAVLLLMSVLAWSLIAIKAVGHAQQRRRGRAFLAAFGAANSLDVVEEILVRRPPDEPYGLLTAQALQARARARRQSAHRDDMGPARFDAAGRAEHLVTRAIKAALDEQATRMDDGLTVLATVGTTAPFVGLFGTVWGVYHALAAIGLHGSGRLDQVAGPVGEALIMTALGLAVALPAVVAYNAFVRRNRVAMARLDGFAFELLTFTTTGEPLRTEAPASPVSATLQVVHPARA